jgi:hypothetical protein
MTRLRMMGFDEKWCGWIEEVVTGGTVSVKLNDQLGPYFSNHKGVRQGDPLSPILFNFVADFLTKMVNKAQSNLDNWLSKQSDSKWGGYTAICR